MKEFVRVAAVILVALPVLFLISCPGAPPERKMESPLPPTSAYLFPTLPRDADMLAGRLARVAESVPAVREATVILSRTTVIVGLELIPGAGHNNVFREVARKIREQDARIRTIRVTCDRKTVLGIKKIARGVHNGTPVNKYSGEIVEIMRQVPSFREK